MTTATPQPASTHPPAQEEAAQSLRGLADRLDRLERSIDRLERGLARKRPHPRTLPSVRDRQDLIVEACCSHFGCDLDELRARHTRVAPVRFARALVVDILIHQERFSLVQAAEAIGLENHTSAYTHATNARKLRRTSPEYRAARRAVLAELKPPPAEARP